MAPFLSFAQALIQDAKSCFSGPFANHKKWANFLVERRPHFDKENSAMA